jgi:hypothetical protein
MGKGSTGVPRSLRRTTPRVVRNWITPMIVVVTIALLFSTSFYVLDMLFLDGALADPAEVVDHYLAFHPDLLTDALPALAMTIVAALGIVLTVIAIIVQLSAERYTSVAMMFLRDPVHVAVLSFYIVAALCAVWLSVTLQAEFVPRSLLLLVMVLTSLGLATMLPYFAYTFWFLEPSNIIDRLRISATLIGRQGLATQSAPEVEQLHGRLLRTLEEITDIANNSIDGKDKIIASDAVNAMRDFLIDYIAAKRDEQRPWYRISTPLAGNPQFITMDAELARELESRGLWVEWKAMHEYRCVYDEALKSMQDINSLIAIDTRYIGEVAAYGGQLDLARLVLRFMNAYLRAAIEACSSRTANNVLRQYRALLEEMLQMGEDDLACEGVGFLAYYGHYAFEEELPAVTVTVAYDIAALCQCAHRNARPGQDCILRKLLNLDNEQPPQGYRQQRSLRGVRRAQTRLAVYYLSVGEEARACMIAEDMRDMSVSVRRAVREDLAEANPPHFWEVVDQGRNLHYLTETERVHLNVFLGWLRDRH